MPLSEILVAANVSPQYVDQLVNDGWTSEHFALAATTPEELDSVLAEIFDDPLNPLQKASLTLARKRCQQASQPSQAEPATVGPPESAAASSSGSWSETFAPKLTSTLVSQLKNQFKKNYPAEILLPETTPSLRLLSKWSCIRRTNQISNGFHGSSECHRQRVMKSQHRGRARLRRLKDSICIACLSMNPLPLRLPMAPWACTA